MLKLLKKYNTQLILISVVLSVVLGIYTPDLFVTIKFLGDIFINLLKLFALPLIASTLIVTLGSMEKSLNNLKSLVRGTTSYMLLSEVVAVAIALTLFNLLDVGKGVDPNLILQGSQYTASNAHSLSIGNFLLAIFPQNIFESLAKFELLPVVIFSTMFGVGCAVVGEKSQPLIKLCSAMRDVSNTCLHGVMMYEVAAALFFSQVLGLDLTLSQQGLIAIASILGGMAEGGIPETSLVSLVVVFKIVNVPLNAISILLPLDRLIDRFRTMVNIFGNMCGAIVVSQFLKKKDLQQNQL